MISDDLPIGTLVLCTKSNLCMFEGDTAKITGRYGNGKIKLQTEDLEFSTSYLDEYDLLTDPVKCECGATACKSNLHSDWCPLWSHS